MAKKALPLTIRNRVKELRMVKASELSPHPQNWRRHPSFQQSVMRDVLAEIGFAGAVLARETPEGLQIIDGHLRAEVTGNQEVPVLVLDVNEAEAKKLLATFDPIGALAEAGNDALINLLSELQIESKAVNDMLAELVDANSQVTKGLTDDDEIPEQVETVCKTGDLWQLGEHRLLCGDATKKEDVDRLMGGEKADMVFTDPPYGINLDTDWSKAKSNLDFVREKHTQSAGNRYDKVIGDDASFDPTFILNGFDCKEVFLWGADYYYGFLPVGGLFVWDKRLEESADKMFGSCFELCWSKFKHKRSIVRVKWAGIFGTEKEPDRNKGRLHPTQKPVELSVWFIEKYSKVKQSVIDLFGGSGSTLIACEKLNRRCFMMEIDEHYCDVIIQRWQDFTGQKAVLCPS